MKSCLALAVFVPPISGFVIPKPPRQATALKEVAEKAVMSWADYKQKIDALTPPATGQQAEEEVVDPAKRRVADDFWLKDFEEEKERLHQMNEAAANINQAPPDEKHDMTSFDEYEHNFIDPILEKETHGPLEDHMDPAKRAKSNMFWLLNVLDEKTQNYM